VRDVQTRRLALAHLHDALVPALDDVPDAQLEAEGLPAVARGVKLVPVRLELFVVYAAWLARVGLYIKKNYRADICEDSGEKDVYGIELRILGDFFLVYVIFLTVHVHGLALLLIIA
jgi:hypothetical protein